MTPDEKFREMPLEVRVSGDAIAEIYGVRDFFGNYTTATAQVERRDEEIWEEMRAVVVRKRDPWVSALLSQGWRGTLLSVGAGVLVAILIFWWAK